MKKKKSNKDLRIKIVIARLAFLTALLNFLTEVIKVIFN